MGVIKTCTEIKLGLSDKKDLIPLKTNVSSIRLVAKL
jgi:hypothetical protein